MGDPHGDRARARGWEGVAVVLLVQRTTVWTTAKSTIWWEFLVSNFVRRG
jgi:hypothetical protein